MSVGLSWVEQVVLWACLWEVVLIMLTDMCGPRVKVGGTSPGVWILDCVRIHS